MIPNLIASVPKRGKVSSLLRCFHLTFGIFVSLYVGLSFSGRLVMCLALFSFLFFFFFFFFEGVVFVVFVLILFGFFFCLFILLVGFGCCWFGGGGGGG